MISSKQYYDCFSPPSLVFILVESFLSVFPYFQLFYQIIGKKLPPFLQQQNSNRPDKYWLKERGNAVKFSFRQRTNMNASNWKASLQNLCETFWSQIRTSVFLSQTLPWNKASLNGSKEFLQHKVSPVAFQTNAASLQRLLRHRGDRGRPLLTIKKNTGTLKLFRWVVGRCFLNPKQR